MKMDNLKVAILGATGAVGVELAHMLFERQFPLGDLRLLASPRSAGQKIEIGGRCLEVEAVSSESFRGIDIAFFSAGGSVSLEYAAKAVDAGAIVIDNTSAFRLKDGVPLVVPEVNPEALNNHRGIIANPNCSTIIMAVVLKPIHDAAGIERVVVSTYQAVSGAGTKGMRELADQVADYAAGRDPSAKVLPVASAEKHYPILFNAIPQIDVFDEGNYTKEEWKMINETNKIFGEDLRVTATTVRIPVMRSHAEAINIQTERPLSPEDCRRILREAPGVVVQDEPNDQLYPMPLMTSGHDPVFVGRIRQDYTVEHGLNLWVVGDQIRKGAALNAIQIAEHLVNHSG